MPGRTIYGHVSLVRLQHIINASLPVLNDPIVVLAGRRLLTCARARKQIKVRHSRLIGIGESLLFQFRTDQTLVRVVGPIGPFV